MIRGRTGWRVLWCLTMLSIVGCSATNTADKPETPTSPDDPKALYSLPTWHEPLQRFNDAANAKDSQDALKGFAEFSDATTGAPGRIAANLEAERGWAVTINKLATQNGDIERAVLLVSAKTTWSHVRERVYEIVSLPPTANEIDKRINVRLGQLAVIRVVMDKWAEYEGKQIEKAKKALGNAKGYLDEARTLKLPEIVWRNFEIDQEKDQVFTVDVRTMVPSTVKVTRVVPTANPNDKTKVTVDAGTGEKLAIVTVTIVKEFEGPADVRLDISYTAEGDADDAKPKSATTTVRYFQDVADLAWNRFSEAVVEAGRGWVKDALARNQEVKDKLGGTEPDPNDPQNSQRAIAEAFVETLFDAANEAQARQLAKQFLADKKLFDEKEAANRDAFRDALVDTFIITLSDARKQRDETKGTADEQRATKRQNLHDAFAAMIKTDDPRKAIGPIISRGTDPVALYSLVAALRDGLTSRRSASE